MTEAPKPNGHVLYSNRKDRVVISVVNSGNEIEISVASKTIIMTYETARDVLAGLKAVFDKVDRERAAKESIDPY